MSPEKNISRLLLLRQSQQTIQLLAGDHTCFIHDQHATSQRGLRLLVFKQSGYGHGIAETDLLQFLDSASRRRDGGHLMPGLPDKFLAKGLSLEIPRLGNQS